MHLPRGLIICPVCYAITPDLGRAAAHIDWHESTATLRTWTPEAAREELAYLQKLQAHRDAGDDAPTAKLPPITDTVRRRPPVPAAAEVRELRGADLLRAIASELERADWAELDREDQGADDAGDHA